MRSEARIVTGDIRGAIDSPTIDEVKAALRADFPAWSILFTDKGRWWAQRPHHTISDVIADTADMLREQLGEVADVEGEPWPR